MDTLALSFLIWIAVQTGLEIPASPSILVVSADEMRERSGRGYNVVSLYDRATATVYLPESWDGAELYDRAMLLHELVHHVQELNRVPSPCNAERERLAYDLTRKWLNEQGVADPYTFLKVDELTITILSTCPDTDGLLPPPMRGESPAKLPV